MVIQLVQSSNRETVAILRCMLEKAVDGKLMDFAGCFRLSNGTEEAVFTGRYGSDPDQAVNAAMRLSLKLMRKTGELG